MKRKVRRSNDNPDDEPCCSTTSIVIILVIVLIIILLSIGYALLKQKAKRYNNNNIVSEPIFTAATLERLAKQKNMDDPQIKNELIELSNKVKQLYETMDRCNIQPILTVSLPYSDDVLKQVSNQYHTPVVFVNQPNQQLINQWRKGNNALWSNNTIVSVRKKINHSSGSIQFDYRKMRYDDYLTSNSWQLFNASAPMSVVRGPGSEQYRSHGIIVDVFESSDGNTTGIHNEINSTINVQVSGRKQWTLVDPQYSDLLIPLPLTENGNNVSGLYSTSLLNKETNKVPSYQVVLNPGDVLFVPSWWWHECVSIGDSYSYSIRCAHKDTWYHPIFAPQLRNLLTGAVLPHVHQLVYRYLKPDVGTNIEKIKQKYGSRQIPELVQSIIQPTLMDN